MYEWLKEYRRLEEEIDYLEYNLEQTDRELRRWSGGDLSNIHLSEKSKGARVEEKLSQIKRELLIKREQKEKLHELIKKFKGLDNMILRMKYIEGMTLEDISLDLNYSHSHIKKKHAELVRMIKFLQEYESVES